MPRGLRVAFGPDVRDFRYTTPQKSEVVPLGVGRTQKTFFPHVTLGSGVGFVHHRENTDANGTTSPGFTPSAFSTFPLVHTWGWNRSRGKTGPRTPTLTVEIISPDEENDSISTYIDTDESGIPTVGPGSNSNVRLLLFVLRQIVCHS